MTCIVVNDNITVRNAIKMLINQTDNLALIASFNNTFEASKFMSENTVDLVFFNIQIDEANGYEFIKAIPRKTFVIFISEFSSTAIRAYKPDTLISPKPHRFKEAVDMARAYCKVEKKENSNIQNDYFVM